MKCETETKKEQPICFHLHSEQLKLLQSGDQKSIKDERNYELPSRADLSAFLEIGAEAEKRNEAIIKEMQCALQKYSTEIEKLRRENCAKVEQINELHKKVCDQENTIQSLTLDLYDGNQETANDLACEITQLEQEKNRLLRENEDLNCKISEIYPKYKKLQESHQQCTSKKALIAKEICFLSSTIIERDKKIKEYCEEIEQLKEEVSYLSSEIAKLKEKMETQCEQFADKSASYQRLISDLQSQVQVLELTLVEPPLQPLRVIGGRGYQQVRDNNKLYDEIDISKEVAGKNQILHHMDTKLEKPNKSIKVLPRFESKGCPENHFESKMRQRGGETDCNPAEDREYKELLKEISQLHYEIYNSSEGSQSSSIGALLNKIKRIKSCIKCHLQREQTKRKEISKQIESYRREFMQLQKEIEQLRKEAGTGTLIREGIKTRVEKEKVINQYIQQCCQSLRELEKKCHSLSKGLRNIDKVQDLVISVNEKCV